MTANIAFVYKQGNTVVDAVPLNAVITTSSTLAVRWATQGVNSYVWSGDAVQISGATVGGIIRTGFAGTAADWMEASNESPMFIGNINESWLQYVDNGCPGDFAQATVTLIAPPTADVALMAVDMPSGCDLGMEDVKVRVRNYGTQPVTGLVLNYNAGGATVSEPFVGALAAGGDTV